jgi:hypothetical protein
MAMSIFASLWAENHPPIRLHPDNPRYLQFRGKPTVLIGSAEHYGAVLNAAFDQVAYLDEVARHRLSHTRVFSGTYCEIPGAFDITNNTLAPESGRLLCPWMRSDSPGCAQGGNRFDLSRWDETYFKRLKYFVSEAGKRGVIVEFVFFCPFYKEELWKVSPMHAANNVNQVGTVDRQAALTLDRHGGLLPYQERLVERVVRELNAFDNLYYEICNEPYQGMVPLDWNRHLAEVVMRTEKDLPQRHLISLNVANEKQKVEQRLPEFDLYNFHYAWPPETIALNRHLERPIGDTETGFKGQTDLQYRREAWQFILSGGAMFSHLDYSFAVGHENGTFAYPAKQPGGGNASFRMQMRILSTFIHACDVLKMQPDTSFVQKPADQAVTVHGLAEEGRQYALYLSGGQEKELNLTVPAGTWNVEWTDPLKGPATAESREHAGGLLRLACPPYGSDVAVRLTCK